MVPGRRWKWLADSYDIATRVRKTMTQGYHNSRYRFMTVLFIAGICLAGMNCSAPNDSIKSILQRQAEALRELPEEQRAKVYDPGSPIKTEADIPVVPDTLTCKDARRIALSANHDIHAAQARMEATLQRISEVRSTYFPTIGVTHNSTRNFQTPESRSPLIRPYGLGTSSDWEGVLNADQSLNINSFLSTLTSQWVGRSYSYGGANSNSSSIHSSTFNLVWTLFDGFSREARLLAAKSTFSASAMQLADVQRLIVNSVDTAYLQALLGREQTRIAEADVKFSQDQLEQAEVNSKSGKATEADVLNFRVRVRAAQADVTRARGVYQTGMVILAELMGLPDARIPDGVELPPMQEETESDLTPPEMQEWVSKAFRDRPDLSQAQHMLDAAVEKINVARGQFSPAVNLSGSYGWENQHTIRYGAEDQLSAMGVEVNWQLFTGGYRTSQMRRAQAEQREAAATYSRVRQSVASEVRQAVINLRNAQEEFQLQKLNIESARKNREMIVAQYGAGKVSLVRLNEAQRDYVTTDAQLAAARIRLRQAWTNLHAAAGAYIEENPGYGSIDQQPDQG